MFCKCRTYKIKLGELAEKLYSFRRSRDTLVMPSLEMNLTGLVWDLFISLARDQFPISFRKKRIIEVGLLILLSHKAWDRYLSQGQYRALQEATTGIIPKPKNFLLFREKP